MDQEEIHSVLNSSSDPFLKQLLEGEGVEDEADDEEDNVYRDGDDLSLTEDHVYWWTEVPGHIDFPFNTNIGQIL